MVNTKIKEMTFSLLIFLSPYFVHLLDRSFLSAFSSKYQYWYITTIPAIIWLYLNFKSFKTGVINEASKNEGLFATISNITSIIGTGVLILLMAYFVFCESNRIPSMLLNYIFGEKQILNITIEKSPQRYNRHHEESGCSGETMISVQDPNNDYHFKHCLTDIQYKELPYGKYKIKFDVINSEYGTYLYKAHSVFSS